MWFSYPDDSNWFPIPCSQVAEIQKMNAEGKKPLALENLMELSEMTEVKSSALNTDLERLDKKYKKNKKKSKNPAAQKPVAVAPQKAAPAQKKPQASVAKPAVENTDAAAKNKKRKKFKKPGNEGPKAQ